MRSLILCLISAVVCIGCSKQPPSMAAGATLTAAQLTAAAGPAVTGGTHYATVSAAALTAFYADFRSELFRQGVTKWDPRFDCNHFATYYVALAQTRFYLASFHSSTPAQTLALGVMWYQSARGAHAIVMAITDRGLLFIEPQTGDEITLTPAERQSAFLTFFG